MKKIIFLMLIVSHSSLISQSQFQRTIGGAGDEYAFSIIQTTDGSYVVAGVTYSFGAGSGDMYIVKLDASGTLQWPRTVGGPGYEAAEPIIQTADGGYAVAGVTTSFGGGYPGDMYIVKLGASGSLQWSRTVGGTDYEGTTCIVQTAEGGYAVGGLTESFGAGSGDFYIVKLDASGTLQWSRTVGGTAYDGAINIVQSKDGGYAIAGYTLSFGAGDFDMYIVKLDASGSFQWSRTVGGTRAEWAYSIIQSPDAGYVVAGYTYSFGVWNCNDCNDMYIVKLDSGGTLQWTRNVGGPGADFAHAIIQTTDGGYALVGGCLSFGNPDWYIVKLNSGGSLQWSKNFRGGVNGEYAMDIVQTTDGGYVSVGTTRGGAGGSEMSIVKFDANANTCVLTGFPPSQSGTGGIITSPNPTVTSPSPTVTSPSPTVGTGGILTNVCVIGIQPISNEVPSEFKLYQNYPNPFNPNSKIKFQVSKTAYVILAIFDILGHEVESILNEQLKPGIYEVQWDAANYPSGVYYYRIETEGYIETKKMVLVR
jgi:type IX secretion system substrate protein/beta-propeller uncharacterized protein DUF5122